MFHRLSSRIVLAGLAVLLALPVLVPAAPADAIAISPFVVGYHAQLHGGITFAQNSSLTCSTSRDTGTVDAAGCTAARTGAGASTNNNNWIMEHVDIDADATTFNSSASQLVLPPGTTVEHAVLYWGARRKGANNKPNVTVPFDRVRLAAPGAGYVDVVADRVIAPTASQYSDLPYQARADVTALVRAAGAGEYTVANLAAALGSDRYAGWTLAVVYTDPSKPLRDITLFEGLTVIQRGAASDTITVSGFTAPVAGPVDATIGLVAYDGDRASTGDTASLNGAALASAISPATNYFNSTVDTFGSPVTTRTPAYFNNLGYDVKVADATGIIPNSATSAQIAVSTSGETVYVGVITTRIDLTAPRFPTIKSVTNLANNDPAKVGDTLEYTVQLDNVGDDPADGVVVTDPIPTNTSYVPGSLQIDGVPVTDAAGDDRGELAASPSRVVARVGTGAGVAAGGRIGVGQSATVTFQVTVLAPAAGTSIDNVGTLDYVAATLGDAISTPTNTTTTPVLADDLVVDPPGTPELAAVKLAPERLPVGEAITYDVVVRNDGTAAATAVVVTDAIPAGVTITSATAPCSVGALSITCALGELAAGDRIALTFSGTVDGDLADGTVVTNSLVVSATNAADATASASTTVSASPDLSLRKTVVGTLVAGGSGTYRFTVTNSGTAAAHDVVVSDPLPTGVTPAPGGPCVEDPETPRLLTCPLGVVAAGETVSVDVRVLLSATLSGSVVNGAVVSAAAIDRDPTDNTSTVTASLAPPLPATGSNPLLPLLALVLVALGSLLVWWSPRRADR